MFPQVKPFPWRFDPGLGVEALAASPQATDFAIAGVSGAGKRKAVQDFVLQPPACRSMPLRAVNVEQRPFLCVKLEINHW